MWLVPSVESEMRREEALLEVSSRRARLTMREDDTDMIRCANLKKTCIFEEPEKDEQERFEKFCAVTLPLADSVQADRILGKRA